ncbi:pentapeptide repeat-containing protein [Nitrosopumilus sp.]|uniref:pentapeptide repeat-containing protein n=1 Tax=Nitrosopumilus sp. TaxID=2024843 RepID=UPI00247C0B6E|nr:pentapeptide repeat-containing protein [Nitrosopumilus sp.]MCV0409958.1 pentapeptide repeat-containing protein [Nitrosopumilus sp.]
MRKGLALMKNNKIKPIMAKLILVLPLLIFISLTDMTTANAIEDLGIITIDLKYTSGDRIDTYQTVLKIFQDENEIPYRVIEFPEKNPIIIDLLPTGFNYKIDVYVNGMLSGTTKNVVGDNVVLSIPASGGIIFQALYKNGETPIEGAEILIRSNDGHIWQQDTVGKDGKSKRFWMQSNNLIDDYYIAEVIIEKNISYTSDEKIKFFPNYQGEIKIKTPWPKIIDDLITVSVYNDTSNKVTKTDGKFIVELYDNKNNKISQSIVNDRGESYFSNIKVGQYTFKAIIQPSDTIPKAKVFAETNRIITGEELEIKIPRDEFASKGLENTCNCVAFRLDDVQDYYLNVPQIEIMSMFQKKVAPLTIGIIGGFWGEDPKILNFVKQDMTRPIKTLEIGSHSWNNSPLTNYDKDGQRELLLKANNAINKTLGVVPKSFIAVENKFNEDTKTVLQELNFTHFTAHIQESHSPPYPLENSKLYYLPASTQTAILNVETNLWENISNDVTYNEANNFLKQHGFAVVMMHPYEFAETDLGVYTGKADLAEIEKLGKLIDQFRINGIEIVSLSEITKSSVDEDIQIKEELEPDLVEDTVQDCNCVAFRFVTVQDYWLNDVQIDVIDTFIRNNAGLTVGVIGELFGQDAKLTNYLKTKINVNNNIEIANNGWSYDKFSELTESEQNAQLKQSNDHIKNILDKSPSGFIPPFDIFNQNTISSLNSNNMKYISSNVQNDPPPYNPKSEIRHFPASSAIGTYTVEFNVIQGVDHEKTLKDIQTSLERDGFAVVALSPQEFSKTEKDKYVNQINEKQIYELEILLEKIQKQGLEIVPIVKIDQLFTKRAITDTDKNLVEHCNQPLAPNVDLSGCKLKNQLIEEIELGNAILRNTDLKGTTIRNVDLRNATITDADLRRAQFSGVSFAEGKLSGSNLSNVNLYETDLRGTDFQGATIRYSNFGNSDAKGASFIGADLTGSIFKGVGFSNVDLVGADLTETDFSGINFGESTLDNANLSGANLTGAVFIKSKLLKTKLIGADLTNANFKDANLSGADLSEANLKDINLSNAILTEIDLRGADLTQVILNGVDLTNADLTNANLSGADLSGVNLNGVNLSGADLTGVNLSGVQIKNVKLTDANLSGVNLSGVNLSGVNLSGVNLSGSNLMKVDLTGNNLTQVILKGSDLTESDLHGTNLNGVDLTSVNLNGVNLSGADLTQVILNGVDLTNADLTNANLSGADLTGVNLNGVNLSGADLTQVILNGVDLTNADLTNANLSGADLSGADLSGSDLTRVNFENSNMNRINLHASNLSGILLKEVNLSNSDLTATDLTGANLSGADLTGADLTGADLTNANLSGASLTGADLTNIKLNGADLTGADLTNTEINKKDLENAKSDDKTKLPERGFFFFRELFAFFESLFN